MCCINSKVCNAAAKSQQYFNSSGVAASTAAARLRPSSRGGQQMSPCRLLPCLTLRAEAGALSGQQFLGRCADGPAMLQLFRGGLL